MPRAPLLAPLLLALALTAAAQPVPDDGDAWGVRVRAVVSGSSHASEPNGYKVYSGVTLGAAVLWRVIDVAAIELAFRTESREVEGPAGQPAGHRLGAFEMLPLTLTAQWRPLGRRGTRTQPYVGAGVNATFVWEKSGILDRTHPPASYAPVVQLGTDIAVSRRAVLNFDVTWHPQDVEFADFGETEPTASIDPLAVGLGLGVAF